MASEIETSTIVPQQFTESGSVAQTGIKPLSLRANFIWTLVGNVVYSGCSWLMLVVLAKLGTPEMVGSFALGLAVTTPVILFACLQLRAIQVTDVRREYLFRDYFGLRLLMMAASLVLIAVIVLVSGYDHELALTVLVIGIGKAIDSISDVIYGALQQQEKMDRISVSLILKGILSLALLALGLVLTHSVFWASVGWTLASLIVVLAYDVWSGVIVMRNLAQDSLMPRFNWQLMRKLSWLALPLGITMLLISLNSSIPRYFIEQHGGEHDLGIFAALAYLMTAGTTVVFALGQSVSPRLAKNYAFGERYAFRLLVLQLIGIGAALGLIGVVVAIVGGQPLLTLLYRPEYAQQLDVFVWLMVAAGVSYVASFLGYGITAARDFKSQAIIFAICTAFTVLLSALLIPRYGILGAAWATLLVNGIQLILMGYRQYRVLRPERMARSNLETTSST